MAVGSLAIIGTTLTNAGTRAPDAESIPSGHWIFNSALGTAFHVGGETKTIDAELVVPDAEPGSHIVQTDEKAFVLGKGSIYEFGKSDLAVANPVAVAANEWPMGLEVAGVAYAVHVRAGLVTRFGDHRTAVEVGGPITEPVVTTEGTLWLHRPGTGQLCQLPVDAERLSCPARIPDGHMGALTLASGTPVFVDFTDATMTLVSSNGLGARHPLNEAAFSERSVLARAAIGERVAILEPELHRLHLVDTASLFGLRPPAPPITTSVRPGSYRRIESSGSVLAMIDEATNRLVTIGGDGRQLSDVPIPVDPQLTPQVRAPAVVAGKDGQLYVDSSTGEHVLVIDRKGQVVTVRVAKPHPGIPTSVPAPTPVAAPEPTRAPDTKRTRGPAPERSKMPKPGPRHPKAPREPAPAPAPKPKPTPKASKPGAPGRVVASVSKRTATVSWRAAAAHGAPIGAYLISWSGGSRTVRGNVLSTRIDGLASGTGYVFSVRARNRVGTGPTGRSGRVETPSGIAGRPRNLVAVPGDERVDLFWDVPKLNGGALLGYDVAMVIEPVGMRVEDKTSNESMRWDGIGNSDDVRYHFYVRAVTKAPDGRIRKGPSVSVSANPH